MKKGDENNAKVIHSNPRMESIELPIQSAMSPTEARTILEKALANIPNEKLVNFRGGSITLIS